MIKTIHLKYLPNRYNYGETMYTYFTHLQDVAQRAYDAGEDILTVIVTNRKRKGMYYHPKFNRKFVTKYYFQNNIKNPLKYYRDEEFERKSSQI